MITMEEIRNDLNKLERDIGEIKLTLHKVHTAIVGSELSKDGGIVKRLSDVESLIDDYEKRLIVQEKKQIKYNVYTIIMWVCAGGIGMAIFSYVMLLVFHK